MKLQEIINKAKELDGSDIHISAGNPLIIRVHGEIVKYEEFFITPEIADNLAKEMMSDLQVSLFEKGADVDVSYSDDVQDRLRVNVFRQKKTTAIVMRLIDNKIPTIDEMNLPPILKEFSMLPRGMVLITGPTGSGKSTTLASMIDFINESRAKHILTMEDPIEFLHPQKMSVINQREMKTDSDSFAEALKSSLREDPDIILVGEMRDPETIQLALTAAETGHLVLSTLHTIGAPETLNRIVDSFPPHQQSQVRSQMSSSLKAVVSQVLVPKIGGGRVAAHEIMISNAAIANNIRENKITSITSVMETGMREGMILLDRSLAELVKKGLITKEAAYDYVKNRDTFDRLVV